MSAKPRLPPLTTFAAAVGAVVRARRERAGFSQADIAGKLGMFQTQWSRYETGRAVMTVEHLAALASILGVSPSSLLQEAGDAGRDGGGLTQCDMHDDESS
jgi:transcriptional regulator with XRE-family HTH domain